MASYDVIVIGGGVVGCAVLCELTMKGYRCLLLEKNSHLVSGASSGNSGMLVRPDTMYLAQDDGTVLGLEQSLLKLSYPIGRHFMEAQAIPSASWDSIIIAFTHEETQKLRDIQLRDKRNNVTDVTWLSAQQVTELEPNVSGSVLGGLLVPGEMVVDSCLLAITMAHQARRNGAQILCDQTVIKGERNSNNLWTIWTDNSTFSTRLIINAAGLYGDLVDKKLLGNAHFSIKPRKGQFIVFEKAASQLLKKCMILPVPSEKSKGVIIFPSVYGNLVVGPTAEETDEKEHPSNTNEVINSLIAYGYGVLPELRNFKIIGQYAGVRPATQFQDFQIIPDMERNYITIGGIRSTGVTACWGIASYVLDLIQRKMRVTPSGEAITNQRACATCWTTQKPSYVLDGVEYTVTHPLMRIGLQTVSKL